ncbi:hypothetical protein B0J13DRAFT_563666 [Dactylonectria estremocensis]|uniref:NWD NACHT-NTPase N-terminal domain-containing protein n=1 Tax=Dactylonectria estremocensis TaxID=1079267 RepID=A0A9P9E2R5_9HYPO|nr:hypothetical protein B0J13DRAFT_563666 [Dactylonectria estremocensis]
MSPAATLTKTPQATTSRVKRIVGRIRHHANDTPSARPCSLHGIACSHNRATRHVQETELWNTAYDALKANLSTTGLVLAYESILIQQLPNQGLNGSSAGLPGGSRRLETMAAVASAGLTRDLSSQSDAGDDLARNVLVEARKTVASLLDGHPGAAVAWAGICSLTPLLLDPLLRHPDVGEGFLYLTTNIPRFTSLPHILQRSAWRDERDFLRLREQTREAVLVLYRHILECEMNCVCAAASSWNRAARNVVDWHGWQAMAERMREADAELTRIVEKHVTEETQELIWQGVKADQGSLGDCKRENSSHVGVVVDSGNRD